MAQKPQSFESHTRQVPIFVAGMLVLFVNLGGRLYVLRYGITYASIMGVLVALVLVPLFVTARQSTVMVQDRVIRLEMRLRLAGLLPADLQSRISEFTVDQLVSLRFASDAELPGLARKVLDDKITDRKAIKKMVKDWQADWMRA
ncbi:MAG: DUF6526 family protein [Acidobacteriia bacterium]|nr:DUF6526 family protein [Terriglobia bacterium]